MSYTEDQRLHCGHSIDDEDIEVYIANGEQLLTDTEFSGAAVSRSSEQTISDTTDTAMTWVTEEFDDGGYYAGGSPTRLTVPTGIVRVFIMAFVLWADDSGLTASLSKNGSTTFDGNPLWHQGATRTHTLVSPILEVSATDYFELIIHQNSGGDLGAKGRMSIMGFAS